MSQLHAEILRARKTKKSESNYNYLNLRSSVSSNQNQIFESNNEEIDNDISIEKESGDLDSEADWDIVIDEWDELLSDEQLDDEFDNETNNESDFYDSKIHPAENQAAKWKLEDLFLSNLPSLSFE